jgi:hypothetical protein
MAPPVALPTRSTKIRLSQPVSSNTPVYHVNRSYIKLCTLQAHTPLEDTHRRYSSTYQAVLPGVQRPELAPAPTSQAFLQAHLYLEHALSGSSIPTLPYTTFDQD